MRKDEVHSSLQLFVRHAPVRGQADAARSGVDDHSFLVELSFDLFRVLALQGYDPAPPFPLARSERPDAGLVATFEDAIGMVAQALLDVVHTDLEDQLQPRQPRVMRGYRPSASLQPAGVVGE